MFHVNDSYNTHYDTLLLKDPRQKNLWRCALSRRRQLRYATIIRLCTTSAICLHTARYWMTVVPQRIKTGRREWVGPTLDKATDRWKKSHEELS